MISITKELDLSIKYRTKTIYAKVELSFYDDASLPVPEFSYNTEYVINDNDEDKFAELLSNYLFNKYSRGFNQNREFISLEINEGMLVEV